MTRQHQLTINLLLILGSLAGATQGRCEIRILRSSQMSAGTIRLGDVAAIHADSPEETQELEKLVVGQLVDELVVDIERIHQVLEEQGIAVGGVDVYGSSCCRVICLAVKETPNAAADNATSAKASVRSAQGEAEMIAELTSQADSSEETVQDTLGDALSRYAAQAAQRPLEKVKCRWQCRDEEILALPATHLLHIRPEQSNGTGLGQVRYKILINGASDKAVDSASAPLAKEGKWIDISGRVSYLCQSVIAVRPIRAGEVIADADVKVLPHWITSLRESGLEDLDAVVGQEAARAISASTRIEPGMIRKVQLVSRRSFVDVKSTLGPVSITFRGVAQDDGGYGDTIAVRNPENDMIVHGVITGPGRVSVCRPEERPVELAQERPGVGGVLDGLEW